MQLIGAKNLRDYIVEQQTGTAGFGSGWKIFSARARKEGGGLVRKAAFEFVTHM